MKAVFIEETGLVEVLQLTDDYQKPVPVKGDVLVRIHATSVNPVDLKTRRGVTPFIKKPRKILGGDLAGVVEEAGPGSSFSKGDKVWGLTDGFQFWTERGTYAELAAVPERWLARSPAQLSLEDAASLPLVALTAYQALRPADLQPGQRVLIHAGSGGVGTAAIQIAKAWGAYVATTASDRNQAALKALGADEVVDYTAERFEDRFKAQPFDVVVDTIGGDYRARSMAVLKRCGFYAHVLNQGWLRTHGPLVGHLREAANAFGGNLCAALRLGPHYKLVLVQPSGPDMAALGQLVANGRLRPVIDRTFHLNDVREAHAHLEGGHICGKVVLRVLR